MQGKILAITGIILGFYILASVLMGRNKEQVKPQPHQIYHIGCYDIERPLSSSREAQRYISQLSDQLNATSTGRMSQVKARMGESRFVEGGGNEIARQFQKYIASYQNIKSRNQYQQSYYNTLKQTKDSFLHCREEFNRHPWNCRSLAHDYNTTDHTFQLLKGRLSKLMQQRADHLNITEDLLRDEQDITKDLQFTEKYTREINLRNQHIARKEHEIHADNQTLLDINNKLFRFEHELNYTYYFLIDCSKNRKEIDYCKNISEYVTGLYDNLDLEELERSMAQKKKIIELLKAHLIQSKKLGEDVTDIQQQLENEKRELEEQELLYLESNNTGKCSQQLQFRCSHENVAQLQRNITHLNTLIANFTKQKEALADKIRRNIEITLELENQISRLNQELKNNAVDIDHLKLKEEKKKKQLKLYRETLNDIVFSIGKVNKEIAEVKLKRLQQNKNVDKLMRRSEQLIECLGKKELYQKLDSKKPKNTEEDEMLKHQASQSLTALLKKLLGK